MKIKLTALFTTLLIGIAFSTASYAGTAMPGGDFVHYDKVTNKSWAAYLLSTTDKVTYAGADSWAQGLTIVDATNSTSSDWSLPLVNDIRTFFSNLGIGAAPSGGREYRYSPLA